MRGDRFCGDRFRQLKAYIVMLIRGSKQSRIYRCFFLSIIFNLQDDNRNMMSPEPTENSFRRISSSAHRTFLNLNTPDTSMANFLTRRTKKSPKAKYTETCCATKYVKQTWSAPSLSGLSLEITVKKMTRWWQDDKTG